MIEDTNASRIGSRIAMQLAEKLKDSKPSAGEGELAIAAWQRCVCAVDSLGLIHPDDRRFFHAIATSEGL